MSTPCDGAGRLLCESCDGTGIYSAPYIPSLGLYTISTCTTCMGKKWAAGRCPGCPACAKRETKTDTQGSLFKP